MSQYELEMLDEKFKKLEKEALVTSIVPEDMYLCIRLDGFKATKQYLKDVLINEDFNKKLQDSYESVFSSFKSYFTKTQTSSIVCAFVVNDEVSIILNKDIADYGKRVMKTCTLFSGILSANMTKQFKGEKTLFFDGRPLFLSKQDISEYIRYRYLLSKRYNYWKVLRLSGFKEANEDKIKKNLDNALKSVIDIKKESEAQEIINTIQFYITEKDINPKYYNCIVNDRSMRLENLEKIIDDYLNYLHSTILENY